MAEARSPNCFCVAAGERLRAKSLRASANGAIPALRIFNNEVLCFLVPVSAMDFARRIIGRKADLQTLLSRTLSAAARHRLAASRNKGLTMAPDGRENRWQLMTHPHIAERAEVWSQTGARHGLAFAFPILDRRVVEFSLSLPSELFLRGGFRRRLFRDAMADVLPALVRLRHQKYQPFPSQMLDVAEGKDEILAQIDTYEQNESVCRMIDLAHLRRLTEAFPPPERVREEIRGVDNPTMDSSMATVARALEVAAYIEQHGGEQTAQRNAKPLSKSLFHASRARDPAGD